MPEYIYGCANKHRQQESHGMNDNPLITCASCGLKMHRIPQAFSVNWGGLPPHLEHKRPPVVRNMLAHAQARREKYLETKGTKNG